MIVTRPKYQTKKFIEIENSMKFNGVNQAIEYLDWDYEYIDGNTPFSFSLFVKISNKATHVGAVIFNSVSNSVGLRVRDIDGKFQFQKLGNSSNVNFDSSFVYRDDIWYHLVFTYNNGTIKSYVNAVKTAESAFDFTDTNMGNAEPRFSIGGNVEALNDYCECEVAYFRIHNAELSEEEITYTTNQVGKLLNESRNSIIFEETFQNKLINSINSTILSEELKYSLDKKVFVNGALSNNGSGLTRITVNNTFKKGEIISVNNTTSQDGRYKIIEATLTYIDINTSFSNADTGITIDNVPKKNEGTFRNFTNSELGIVNKSLQTTKLDFYKRTQNPFFKNGIFFDGQDSTATILNSDIPDLQVGNPFYIVFEASAFIDIGNATVFRAGNLVCNFNKTVVTFGSASNENTFRGQANFNNFDPDKRYKIVLSYNGGSVIDSSSFNIFCETTTTQKLSTGFPQSGFSDIIFSEDYITKGSFLLYYFGFKSGVPLQSEIDDYVFGDLTFYPNLDFEWNFEEIVNNTIPDKVNNIDLTVNNATSNSGIILEFKSSLPPILQKANISTLSFSGSHDTIDEDFCIIFRGSLNSFNSNNIDFLNLGLTFNYGLDGVATPRIKLADTTLQFAYNGDSAVGETTVFNPEVDNMYIVNCKRVSTDVYNVEVYINGYLVISESNKILSTSTITQLQFNNNLSDINSLFLGVSAINLTKRQIADIGFRNLPPKEFKENAWSIFQFQAGSAFENGTNVFLRNLGLKGTITDLTITGLTGGSSAIQLTDWKDNIVELIN